LFLYRSAGSIPAARTMILLSTTLYPIELYTYFTNPLLPLLK